MYFMKNADFIDDFYSEVPLETWQKILSPRMHYHFGEDNSENEDIFDRAVRSLYPYIPYGSTVLDCGCGWGGPARMLISEQGCDLEGVTLSRQQSEFISDFKVYHQDLAIFTCPRAYDTAFFLESFTHFDDPLIILRNLSASVNSIVIKDYSSYSKANIPAWGMNIYSPEDYIELLKNAKFKVIDIQEYPNHMKSSLSYWYKNIRLFLRQEELRGQVRLLNDLCLSELLKEGVNTKPSPHSISGIIVYAVKS